jgi:hypothetical protein
VQAEAEEGREPQVFKPIESFVDTWLAEPGRNHLSILGDFGSGKTWFCQRYAYLAAKRYLADPVHNRIPILITLRDYSRAYDVEQLVTDVIANRYKVSLAAGYKTFARLLPDMAKFWNLIASEEEAHAEVIDLLNKKVATGLLYVDAAVFTTAGVQSEIEFLARRVTRYAQEGITREAALNAAIDSERGALEHKFFDVFTTKDPELLAEFRALAVHTQEHLKRLEDERDGVPPLESSHAK